jgi:membrane-bound ClpP family serine protease
MCFSSFGPDVDVDGDGLIDADTDSGVSVFTFKSITAFFAVGGWSGLLVCALVGDDIQWVSIIVAIVAGGIAMAAVVLIIRAMLKLQCNGAFQIEKLVGQKATVYVSVPPKRSGRGKITLNAQGKYVELDAVTDCEEKIAVDEQVEIIATENECTVIKRAE